MHKVGRVFNPEGLDSLILFVTNACNLRCGFCCYAENLNVSKDISLENILKVSESIGSFRALLVSGGEPFVRGDLDQVLLAFASNNQISTIYIPTNGWFLEKTDQTCRSFLEQNHEVVLTIGFSLDGLEEVHDTIRGKKGSFQNACKTIGHLSEMQKQYPNLRVRVNSVVTPDNIHGIQATIDYFFQNFALDEHTLEIVRDLTVSEAQHQSIERQAIADEYLRLSGYSSRLYAKGRQSSRPPWPLNHLPHKLTRHLVCAYHHSMAQIKRNRLLGRLWPVPCTAGRKIMVIDGSGSVRACEHRGEVVHLKQFDFNVQLALAGGQMKLECACIKRERCDCLHGCFIANSLENSKTAVFTQILPSVARNLFHS